MCLQITSMIDNKEFILEADDFSGHVGKISKGFRSVYGGYGFSSRNGVEKGFCSSVTLMAC